MINLLVAIGNSYALVILKRGKEFSPPLFYYIMYSANWIFGLLNISYFVRSFYE